MIIFLIEITPHSIHCEVYVILRKKEIKMKYYEVRIVFSTCVDGSLDTKDIFFSKLFENKDQAYKFKDLCDKNTFELLCFARMRFDSKLLQNGIKHSTKTVHILIDEVDVLSPENGGHYIELMKSRLEKIGNFENNLNDMYCKLFDKGIE